MKIEDFIMKVTPQQSEIIEKFLIDNKYQEHYNCHNINKDVDHVFILKAFTNRTIIENGKLKSQMNCPSYKEFHFWDINEEYKAFTITFDEFCIKYKVIPEKWYVNTNAGYDSSFVKMSEKWYEEVILKQNNIMKVDNFIMAVNPEQSKIIQEFLFKNGYVWATDESLKIKQVRYTDEPYLCLSQNQRGQSVITFLINKTPTITFNDFCTKYNINMGHITDGSQPIQEQIDEQEVIGKLYAVMVEGKQTPSKTYVNYQLAEHEAVRLAQNERKTVYILQAVTKVELNNVKITKL